MSHPLHPALVHFPVACWSLGSLVDLAGLYFGSVLEEPATFLIITGLLLAIPTMLTGLMELRSIEADSIAQDVAMMHLTYVISAWLLYAVSVYMRFKLADEPQIIEIIFSVTGFICLIFAGWYGGKLVYVHGVGVQKND